MTSGRSFKKKTMTRWALSYLLVTIIPLLLVIAAFLVTLSANISSVTYANSVTASLVQKSFSSVFERINEIKAEMIVDPDFDELRSSDGLEKISSLDLYYHTADIRRLEQTSTVVAKLFVFSPVHDWFVSDMEWGRIKTMSENSSLGLGSDEVEKMLGREITDIYMYDISSERVLILLPMTFIRSSNPNCLAVGVIVAKSDIFPSSIDDYHDVVIYSTRRDEVVYSYSGRYAEGERNSFFSSLHAGKTEKNGGIIASAGERETENLSCIVLMNRRTYFRPLYILVEIMAAVILLAFFLGTVLMIRNVRRDWMLYSEAMKASGVDINAIPMNATDYSPFVSSVSTLKAETAELSSVISKQKMTLTESALSKLVNGESAVTEDVLASLGVVLVSPFFLVAVLKGDKEAFRALVPSSLVLPVCSEYGEAFILNLSEDDRQNTADLLQNAQRTEGIVSLALSDTHTGLLSVRDSFIEAIIVSEYQKDHEIPFLSYSALSEATSRMTFQYTLEENMMLQKAIRDGDGEKAKSVVEKVIERNRANGVSPKKLRFLLFSISGTIIRTVNGLDERYREVVPKLNFPPILQSQNFQKSLSGVEEIIESVCYSVRAVQKTFGDSSSETWAIYRKVLDYVAENYGDSLMNVSSVADHYGISIAYLSRIFKKYHGINISEYITGYRLDRAKELLEEGRMVRDVGDICGFGSLRTFLRVFKSVEGITPGQYKDTVTKEN